MTKPKVGVVPLSRATFDLARANVNRRASFALLDRLGCAITGPRSLLLDAAGLMRAARTLAGARPDLLLLLQLTFTPAAQTVRIAKTVRAPMALLWGFPEPAEWGAFAWAPCAARSWRPRRSPAPGSPAA